MGLIQQGRQEGAIKNLEPFVRWMWGICEGDTSDGMDDVRRDFGLLPPEEKSTLRQVAGQKLIRNWHITLLCRELEALARGYHIDEAGNPLLYPDYYEDGEPHPWAGQIVYVDPPTGGAGA